MPFISNVPDDLRCDHCGERVSSDSDEGNEDFWHSIKRTYYCYDGSGDSAATVGGYRKVAKWHDAGRPPSTYTEPEPGPEVWTHALDEAADTPRWEDAARAAGWLESPGDISRLALDAGWSPPAPEAQWIRDAIAWASEVGCEVRIVVLGGRR